MHLELDPVWTLLGLAVLVVGFLAGLNPLLVVLIAAIVTGLLGGVDPVELVAALGKAFNDNRFVSVIWIVLPVIGLLEREGLQERARALIGSIRAATTGRLLTLYFLYRQLTAALGLLAVGGHAQMVRPLVAPMAEGAAEAKFGALPEKTRHLVRAHAAGVDNVAVFFGEDIFIAVASILLIKGFLETSGIEVEPLHLAWWAIPTAICALIIHAVRLQLLDWRLARELSRRDADGEAGR